MENKYLQHLTTELVEGVDRLPVAFRTRHAGWLVANQNPDGGFSGREGGSDLYYTGFALRSLAVTQSLTPGVCEKAGRFLKARMDQPASVIDLFSLLVGSFLVRLGGVDVFADAPPDWPERVAATLEQFRTADGGYAKNAGAAFGSTYHSFLVMLALELLDKRPPNLDALVKFVESRWRSGGFVEIPAMKRCGTNPTAAGVGVLQMAGALSDAWRNEVIEFLMTLPSEFEGGFRANDRIPTADLLSTFTASWTLVQLGARDRIDAENVKAYAQFVESNTGGFKGGLWDTALDVEYTFYGIGVMGLFGAS